MNGFFEASDYYTGPPITPALVRSAEQSLGVKLPSAYTALLAERNGGTPRACCFPTPFENSWAPDHIEIRALLGIGGKWGIDSTSGLGSRDMVKEWGYPDIGVVVCFMPSAGHDTVMLDYSASGPDGEPSVVYVDEDRIPRQIAASFAEFVAGLFECEPVDVD